MVVLVLRPLSSFWLLAGSDRLLAGRPHPYRVPRNYSKGANTHAKVNRVRVEAPERFSLRHVEGVVANTSLQN